MDLQSDLVQRTAIGLNHVLIVILQRWGVPAAMAEGLQAVLPPLGLAVMVIVTAAAAARIEHLWCERNRGSLVAWVLGAVQAAAGLYALRLLYWVYLHPFGDLASLVCRWDYLVLTILGGLALRRVPLQARVWLFAVLSVIFVRAYVGPAHMQVVLFGCLLGFAGTRWQPTNRPGVRVLVQGALMGGLLVWLWRLRSENPFQALLAWGFYSFALFRHLSFVVESSRGLPSTLGGYLCYLLFYPNCMGAMEVYDEFHARNLTGTGARDFRRAALTVVKGNTLLWLAVVIPMDDGQVINAEGFVRMWTTLMVLFFRAACGAMGIWNIIEGGALFLGVRLRPNFRGVLTATNPSQFWRAWRGTMTNWLIRYVYIPLGGNRRHRTFNILGAFVVSTAWHCLGIPFLRPDTWTLYELVPIATWGTVNFAGVATHAWIRRRWPPVEPRSPLRSAFRVCKWPLTMMFGSLTVLLLGFSLRGAERFPYVVRTLLGMEGW